MFGSRPTQPNPVPFFHDGKKNVQVWLQQQNSDSTCHVPCVLCSNAGRGVMNNNIILIVAMQIHWELITLNFINKITL